MGYFVGKKNIEQTKPTLQINCIFADSKTFYYKGNYLLNHIL